MFVREAKFKCRLLRYRVHEHVSRQRCTGSESKVISWNACFTLGLTSSAAQAV